ncbi:hypothetical protein ACFL34_02935 [Candidatus Sumerlaeota bacterium]
MKATKKRLAEINAGSPLTDAEKKWMSKELDKETNYAVEEIIRDLLREIRENGRQDVLKLENSIRCASERIVLARIARAMKGQMEEIAA